MTRKSALIAGTAFALASLAVIANAATAQDQGQSYSADTVSIENFIGRVEIRTGSSDQVSVEISNAGGLVDNPSVDYSGSRVAIDGGQSIRNLNCSTRRGEIRIGRRWSGQHAITDYPVLTITAPASLALEMRESAFQGNAGDLGSLDLTMNSCGRFEAGDIAHDAEISINGSGDVTTRAIGGDADIGINGSGDVVLGTVAGTADIGINGSGDVQMADVGGDAEVGINGSGDVEFGRVAGLDVRISGSGDVEAASMNGAFSARIGGSGDIAVHDGRAEPFDVSINGSGDVSFGGTAVNVTVRESGGGDVDIGEIEGSVDWRRNGRSVLQVGGTR
ncbi:GIN domain-containing protein [Maricaulis salignorans]|uniref:GIN domain-containing protein n=1 Tax=Maricaulis salignorans TaxID=144026 RepID=UPI003A9166C2